MPRRKSNILFFIISFNCYKSSKNCKKSHITSSKILMRKKHNKNSLNLVLPKFHKLFSQRD